MEPMVCDPWANTEEVMHEYGNTVYNELPQADFGAAVLAGLHIWKLNLPVLMGNGIIYDVTGVLQRERVEAEL